MSRSWQIQRDSFGYADGYICLAYLGRSALGFAARGLVATCIVPPGTTTRAAPPGPPPSLDNDAGDVTNYFEVGSGAGGLFITGEGHRGWSF
ncbi:hypothetical protein POX_f07616 [Penicillium oxalicum]|uniref:hypothetical protein n=1 Tax=Penicillium oxalicum TaxID=69781 RepID=UPI0020B6CC1D|nr:hypothetical protein POX_f07616 [Penicillium oxalicum]KAI2787253.1 hypothetical protein POX_f07616 [Penicillium oxalicum]